MTALPQWDSVDAHDPDAELVRRAMAGDTAAFAQIYDRYADRLHDFCLGMVREYDGAADCVQDTFCIAATRLPQLRDPDRLRPWLYSIARNEALRKLRDRRREMPAENLPDVPSDEDGPDTLSARTELADLIAEAAGGLSDRDRAVLDLAFRHGLDGPELAGALGVSHTNANTMVVRLRRTVERSLGALLVSRRVRNDPDACAELRDLLADWDGQFTVLMRKRIARHVESCPTCDDDRRRLVSPAALLGAAPVLVPAPNWLRDKTLGDIQLVCHTSALDATGAAPTGGNRLQNRRILLAVTLIGELAASAALLLTYANQVSTPVTPVEASESAVAPTNPPVAPVQPPLVKPPAVSPPVVAVPVAPPTVVQTPRLRPAPADDEDEVTPVDDELATEPPMSFAPTATVSLPPPPEGGGNSDAGSRRSP
jgi:RNA polymerase sigma factor (sigma-70 family)